MSKLTPFAKLFYMLENPDAHACKPFVGPWEGLAQWMTACKLQDMTIINQVSLLVLAEYSVVSPALPGPNQHVYM